MIEPERKEGGKLGSNALVLGEIRDSGAGERIATAILGTTPERRGQAIAIFVASPGRE